MDGIYVFKGQLQQFYAKYSKYIEKAVQFALALIAFYMINHEMGFMKALTNPVITLGLAVICTFLPAIVTVLGAGALIIVHMFSVSMGMAVVTALVFIVMFIFYVRFTPKMAIFILLTLAAFLLKIPYAVPVALGLIGTPVYAVPIIFGTIIYYMIEYVKSAASSLTSGDSAGVLDQITVYTKQLFMNKEMWVAIAAFVICLFVVYAIRRMSIDHAWKIAMVAGAIMNIVVIAVGDMFLQVPVSYAALIGGNIAAIVIGLILELVFFSVDYSRNESLQFEDDEYYYYVKAVPKIVVAAPEKTVKRINKREVPAETEIIDTEEIRKKAGKQQDKQPAKQPEKQPAKQQENRNNAKKPVAKKRPPQAKESKVTGNTDHLLLTRSLRKELDLDK